MVVFKCKMCGGDLMLNPDSTVAECEYCGTIQTVPAADNDKKLTLFARAHRLRSACEFDKAAGIYETIASEFPEDPECYWGMVLCRYGIEYVDDPATGKKIPTCHRTLPGSLLEDDDYLTTVKYADTVSLPVYKEEANQIDAIQKKILAVVATESPYDIFICYKETDDLTGHRTDDSAIAQDIYTELTREGYRVFFSRITLRSLAGSEYEPYIYAALASAKAMLVLGTRFEYFDAVWVKNEWHRFLDMMNTRSNKVLIPCIRDLDAYDMPREFRNLQALDMADMMFYPNLMATLERVFPKKKTAADMFNGTSGNAAMLLKRAKMYLHEQEWEKASEYADRVLDLEPETADAYQTLLLSTLKIQRVGDLAQLRVDVLQDENYLSCLRFSSDSNQAILQQAAQDAYCRLQYDNATKWSSSKDYTVVDKAIAAFEKLGNWEDSAARAENLREHRKEVIYREAIEKFESRFSDYWQRAYALFEMIPGYKDADKVKQACVEKQMNSVYQNALNLMNHDLPCEKVKLRVNVDGILEGDRIIELLQQARNLFDSISEWKDAQQKAKECTRIINERVLRIARLWESSAKLSDYGYAAEICQALGDWEPAIRELRHCNESMIALHREDLKATKKDIRSINHGFLVCIIVSLCMIAGVVLLLIANSAADKSSVPLWTFSTLLMGVPILCVFNAYENKTWIFREPVYFLRLRGVVFEVLFGAIPVYLVLGIVNYFITKKFIKAVLFLILLASVGSVIICFIQHAKNRNPLPKLHSLLDMQEATIQQLKQAIQ